MNKISLFLIGSVATICLLLLSPSASAHVLITDSTKEIGAILHIQPDDDPVAGEPSHIYYDIQGQQSNSLQSNTTLTISSGDGSVAEVPIEQKGNTVSADYTFPAQGLYTLTLNVDIHSQGYTFESKQRISRGIGISQSSKPTYIWAEILITASGICFAVLAIAIYNRRECIKSYSTF